MLAIDAGNSRIKWAQLHGDEVVRYGAFEYNNDALAPLLMQQDLPLENNRVFISHVAGGKFKAELIKHLEAGKCKSYLFAETKLKQCDVTNSYENPENMGVDRWLAMIAAYNHSARKQDENICVIDCGTAITLDIVSYSGLHVGGLIMPGYQIMYNSLSLKTSNIKNETGSWRGVCYDERLASSTRSAVEKGCSQLVVDGLAGILSRQNKNIDGSLRCIITGGDGDWVSAALKLTNTYEPFLVLRGLQLLASEKCSRLNESEI